MHEKVEDLHVKANKKIAAYYWHIKELQEELVEITKEVNKT